ncbi:preprotein translocase subunit YajC [Rhodococcus zopfii]|uniref:preprotein translocase subunit YajC n=1 Tax=Rhodococcus zopfii TaxID=43772 RepID=UPI001110FEC8|nr:preprotein translocase subunit YajC [Rhodococcus zopfii]
MELLFPLLILALLVPTFLGIRRQKKEMHKVTELQDSLRVGDRVTTTAGLHATVAALSDATVDLEIAPGVVTTWARVVVREKLDDTTGTSDTTDTGTVSFGKDDDTDPPADRPVEH